MKKVLIWFRRDLRIADNAALHAAKTEQVIPIYIHAPQEASPWQPGAASNWWLHHSLSALQEKLRSMGSRLIIRRGDSGDILSQLAKETDASAIYCNRLYDPISVKRDTQLKKMLTEQGLEYRSFPGSLLFEPWQVKTGNDTPYKVYTPFWNACQKQGLPHDTLPTLRKLPAVSTRIKSIGIDALNLLPDIDWDSAFHDHWQPGEAQAHKRLREFIKGDLTDYAKGRDYPEQAATSRLSPHLHFGEISPRQIVCAIEHAKQTARSVQLSKNANSYLREIVWREFTHHVLYAFPQTLSKPLNPRFDNFPWQTRQTKLLKVWQQGQTGFPIIDAGMRELWATGIMHNRVRMIVGSLLTKNANLHWLQGARWFWDTLVDADLAQNTFNWQWIAGCGADAAPYFRIFNPITQSEKFDKHGHYIRKWVTELRHVPSEYIHTPWKMNAQQQNEYKCHVGKDYPEPVLDLKLTREEALSLYKQTSEK